MKIKIIGAGLAGCECAYQLAKNNIKVELFESKRIKKNDIQKNDYFAELVCSNTLRSKSFLNAVGILKEEMKQFDSLIIRAANATCIPSDDALAVDRINFGKYVTNEILNNPNITFHDKLVDSIDDENDITIIASGPLTSEELKLEIQRLIGKQKLFFLDASSPIVEKDSIDFSKTFFDSRHKQEGKYICIPLNEHQFEEFRNELINGKKNPIHDFEKAIFFRGCQPIEQLAIKGRKTLLNGPLSSNNLFDKDNEQPFSVVQLRQDDAIDTLYNIVGFQTNLKWPEQDRIIKTLPGLKNVKIKRYGVMHKNYYINSPKILNHKLQVKRKKNVFFAGQIIGVEGYVESASSGIVAALGVMSLINKTKLKPLPTNTIIGALINYITNEKIAKLNPMKANLGILDNKGVKISEQHELYRYETSMKEIENYIKEFYNK